MRLALGLLLAVMPLAGLRADPMFTADFERATDGVPDGWVFQRTRGECSGAWDAAEPPPAGHSIRLDVPHDATARATWHYANKIPAAPETCYRLRLQVMLAIPGATGAYVIVYENGVEAPANWHMTQRMGGLQDWHEVVLTFKTRPDCEWLRLQCKLWHAVGHCWFDDIVIEPIPETEMLAVPSSVDYQPPRDGFPLQLLWYPAQRRPDRTIHLLPGLVNPVTAFFWGDRARVADPHLIIEAPEGLRLVGPVVAGRCPVPPRFDPIPEPIERDGQRLVRWRLPIPAESLSNYLRPDGPSWERYHYVYALPQSGCPERFTWRWRLETGGELGPEHELQAHLVPRDEHDLAPVPGFRLFAQHTDALRLPTPEGRAQVLQYLRYAGISGGLALSYWGLEDKPLDRELEQEGFFTWTWAWHGYQGPAGEGRAVVNDRSETDPKLVCPQLQAERDPQFWSWLVERYAAALQRERPWLIMNYEPPVFNVCFCPRCRRAFAQFAGMSEADVMAMTPQQLQALPDQAWGRFRAHQNALIIQAHVAAAHQSDPELKFGVCGPPFTEWIAQRGMDIRLFEPAVFLHAPMIYQPPQQYAALVRSTCENTSALVMPFLLASDMAVAEVFPSANDVRLNLLATALSGGHGAVLWVGMESLDGEIMNALRRSMNEIRTLERYIVGAERLSELTPEVQPAATRPVRVGERTIDMPRENSEAPVMAWGWRSATGRLVAVINYGSAPRSVRLAVPGIANAQALFGPAPQPQGEAVLMETPAQELTACTW